MVLVTRTATCLTRIGTTTSSGSTGTISTTPIQTTVFAQKFQANNPPLIGRILREIFNPPICHFRCFNKKRFYMNVLFLRNNL